MQTYEEIVTYFNQQYGISITGFDRKDLFSVQATLAGFDDLMSEFPEAGRFLQTIQYNARLKDYGRINSSGRSQIGPGGLQDYGTGVHEAAHALDFFRSRARGVMYAEQVVEEARKRLGLKKTSRDFKDLCFLLAMDPVEAGKMYEVFAYALESQFANNGNALSAMIYSIIKEGK